MSNNFLKLNADKTVFSRTIPELLPLQLNLSVSVLPSYNSCNLGVLFDSRLSFKQHRFEFRQSSFFHLRQIKSVKTSIHRHMLAFLIPQSPKYKQFIMLAPNSWVAARYDSASDKLKDLHWLSVKYRIKFKLLIMTHRIVYPSEDSEVPAYLSSNISIKKSARVLVLHARMFWPFLIPPNSKSKTVDDRSYRVGIPEL